LQGSSEMKARAPCYHRAIAMSRTAAIQSCRHCKTAAQSRKSLMMLVAPVRFYSTLPLHDGH
jgi:hypothetical protein